MKFMMKDFLIVTKVALQTSFEALKFFEIPKLQKNDKNVNILLSSNCKRINGSSLELPQ